MGVYKLKEEHGKGDRDIEKKKEITDIEKKKKEEKKTRKGELH